MTGTMTTCTRCGEHQTLSPDGRCFTCRGCRLLCCQAPRGAACASGGCAVCAVPQDGETAPRPAWQDGRPVTVGGVLADVAVKTSRKGSRYATATLDDRTAQIQVVFAGAAYRHADLISEGALVAVTGQLSADDDTPRFLAASVRPLIRHDLPGAGNVIGPCARCGALCRRYGPQGQPLCRKCRGAPVFDLSVVVEDLPGWALAGYPELCGTEGTRP